MPTLRCPHCGNSDLHFTRGERVQCSRCRRKWSREELVREPGMAGRSYKDLERRRGDSGD
jgi:hypothetical protein